MWGHDWESARGTIIASRIKGFRMIGAGSAETPLHEFVVDVEKADGTVFRTTVEEPRSGKVMPPDVGATVGVQVRRKDQSVRFDEADPSINTKVQWKKMHDAPDSFRDALEQPPGTPAP